jgi:glycerol kinase
VADVLEVMKEDSGLPIGELRVDGGACVNNLLMQFQADILQVPVVRPKVIETTAIGAAYLAGLAVEFWKSREEVSRAWQVDRTFDPQATADVAEHRRLRWKEALSRAGDWEERTKVKNTRAL